MMGNNGGPAYQIPAQVYYREVDGQMVLLNLDSEQYYGLDAVGANIITRITETSLPAAVDALLGDYEVEPHVLQRDLDELVDALMGAGLLEHTASNA